MVGFCDVIGRCIGGIRGDQGGMNRFIDGIIGRFSLRWMGLGGMSGDQDGMNWFGRYKQVWIVMGGFCEVICEFSGGMSGNYGGMNWFGWYKQVWSNMDGFCGIIGWYELVLDGRDGIYGVISRFCGV